MPAVTAMLDLLLVERGARSFPKGAKIGKEQLCERLLDFLEKPDAGLQKKAPKKKAAAEKKAAVDDDEDDDDDEEEVAPRAAAPKRAARGKTSYVVADDDDDDEEEEEEEDESEAGDSDDEAPAAKKRKAAPKKAPKKKPAPKKKKPAPKPAPAAPVFFDEGPDDAPDETFGLDHSAEITLPLAIPLQLFKAVARRILAQNPGASDRAASKPGRGGLYRGGPPAEAARGDAAGASWIFRGGETRRRRGCLVDVPRRRDAATPRPRRGYSVAAAAAGRGRDVDAVAARRVPRRGVAATSREPRRETRRRAQASTARR